MPTDELNGPPRDPGHDGSGALRRRTVCRGCGSDRLGLVHDFGPQPLAGEFPLVSERERSARKCPLDLTQCRPCGLLQVTHLPPIEDVFHDDYRYASSTVPDLVRHFSDYAEWLAGRVRKGASILEFGCNDGILLARLRNMGFACTGVDPSKNVARIASALGLVVHTEFMTERFVRERGLAGSLDLVTCSNVLAHIDEVGSAVAGAWLALKADGLFSIEVHDADALARDAQFETIYHEHLTYFTARTLRRMVESRGFSVVECVNTPMHGGALRLICRRLPDATAALAVSACGESELLDASPFATAIARCADETRALFERYGPLDAYGAAGRSQMFINMTGTAAHFARVFDDSAFRQGRFIVGTDLPILPFGRPVGRACVILAWNYAPAIARRIRGDYEAVVTLLPQRTQW
jgi:SAM-dependent methyltransferase